MKFFQDLLGFFKKNSIHESREKELSRMLVGIQKLSELTAKDVMIPRVDLVAVDAGSSPEELFIYVANSSHSRFPVYQDTVDNIIGILYVKDLLKKAKDLNTLDINSIIRQAFFIPETMCLDGLLHEMKKKRIHISVVVDEYGGVSGIVSLEDIIEEIVGDILDEFDSETQEFLRIANGIYLIEGRLPIAKFNELLSLSISEEDYDTMGGYVYDLFGKIPACFEKITNKNIDYIIQSMHGNKIKTIKVVEHKNGKQE